MTAPTDDFSSADITRLLGLLEAELSRRGVAASIYVVGGAAIALTYDTGRRTKDVDAELSPEDSVLEAAAAVAESEGLPPTWLNADAKSWIPPRAGPSLPAASSRGLQVEIASPEALLAMKLVASRNRDVPDIKLLADALGVTEPTAMAELVRDQYGEDQLELVHGGYDDMLLWCRTLSARLWP
ncbi:DUF6036 family nucleotidyltransferase [Kribbella sp. CA-253562]|uniref:DUF6036 family nucleotidyltransferase n=1 Tax=Kribbella sp. CA-253562 TaxID=3239942 RepID=UPI003D8E7466